MFNFLLLVLGARRFGPAAWGIFWPAFTLAQIMARLTDLGTHMTLAREVARERDRARVALRSSMTAKLILTALFLPLALLVSRLIGLPFALVAVLAGTHLCLSFTEWLAHYLRGFGRVPRESAIMALDCVLAFVFGGGALLADADVLFFAFSQLAAHAFALALAGWITARAVPLNVGLEAGAALKNFWRQAYPVGISMLAPLGSWRLGVVALYSFGPGGIRDAGLFGAAHRFLEAARFAPTAAAAAAFPSFASRRPQARPIELLAILFPITLLLGAILATPYVATPTVLAFYGDSYRASQPLFSILMLSFPILSVNAILSHWLIARGHERFMALLAGAHLAVHVAGLLWLIPRQGAAGAAWALLAAESATAVFMALRLKLSRERPLA